MKAQLTQKEVDYLFDFVDKRNVPYIDVQYELVDHLASAIEEKMDLRSGLSFQEALREVYNQFPRTGFALFQLEKEKGLKSYWRRKFWNYLRQYIHFPKILNIVLIMLIVVMTLLHFKHGVLLIFATYILTTIGSMIVLSHHKNIQALKKDGKYLVVNTFVTAAGWRELPVVLFFIRELWSLFQDPWIISNVWWAIFIATIFSARLLWVYTMTFEFPDMLKEDLKNKYAHMLQLD